MPLIVGLGNPGAQYAETRHNIGYMVVDALAGRHGTRFVPGRGEFWQSVYSTRERDIILLKPATYMNNSGIAVCEASEVFSIPPEEIVIVMDDFQLPLGRLRIRPSGSDGGHHGLESVIYHLQTDTITRLRCGIGREAVPGDHDATVDFVLSVFDENERSAVRQLIGRAADAVETIVEEGIVPAMNRFNTKEL